MNRAYAEVYRTHRKVVTTQTDLRRAAYENPVVVEAIGRSHLSKAEQFFDRHGFSTPNTKITNWFEKAGETNYTPSTSAINFGERSKTPSAIADDVVAHEYTHHMIQTANPKLPYATDPTSRAVHESLADTMAAAITGDWIHAEDVQGIRARRMDQPGVTISSVDPKDDSYDTSAVPSAAAYRIGSELGQGAMAEIYSETIQHNLGKKQNFETLATGTYRSAVTLYGANSREANAVVAAWDETLELHGDRDLFTVK